MSAQSRTLRIRWLESSASSPWKQDQLKLPKPGTAASSRLHLQAFAKKRCRQFPMRPKLVARFLGPFGLLPAKHFRQRRFKRAPGVKGGVPECLPARSGACAFIFAHLLTFCGNRLLAPKAVELGRGIARQGTLRRPKPRAASSWACSLSMHSASAR